MIISKTPYRISFFGGGTDFPEWFTENPGAVLSTTIDKYCYLSCKALPPFFANKHRFVYSRIEEVIDIDDIKHPCLRHVFKWFDITDGLEIHHNGELPARSGMGSSSSFTVGLINVLSAHMKLRTSKKELASNAIFVERDLINESGGWQDQIAVSYGGLNYISFKKNKTFDVEPLSLSKDKTDNLRNHLLLFYTGVRRSASELERIKINEIHKHKEHYLATKDLVDEAMSIIVSDNCNIVEFGKLMQEGWCLKKAFAPGVSINLVEEAYAEAQRRGAIGGKLLGAGGGGFLLLFAKPQFHDQIIEALRKFVHVPFNFDHGGSKIALRQSKKK